MRKSVTAIAKPVAGGRRHRGALVGVAVTAGAVVVYYAVLVVMLSQNAATQGNAAAVALQHVANALSLGAIYALIALGYTMVYGIIELINFAHGDVFMIGAFLSTVLLIGVFGQTGAVTYVPLLVVLIVAALLFTMPLTGLLNLRIERLFYRPLRNAPRLAPLITAIGVSFILQNIALVIFGSGDDRSPQIFPIRETSWRIEFSGVSIAWLSFFIFGLSIFLMFALRRFVGATRLGRAMRATAQDREAAALMGVDANQTIALTFLIGGSLAGAAGVVWGLNFGYVRHDLGLNAGLKAFTAAVLGGIGNITGAVLGGFIIGFVEVFASALGYARWTQAIVFTLLALVLVFRPAGILGQQLGERA
jgi:branched-chain amino acid transport system permease protein